MNGLMILATGLCTVLCVAYLLVGTFLPLYLSTDRKETDR